METKQKFVKAKFRDIKKIFSFTENFQDLLKGLEMSFKISLTPLETSNYVVSYIDDEEDHIHIENAYDYSEALKFLENSNQNFLNLLVLQNNLINQKFNNSIFKKDNKDNFEYIEVNSFKSHEYQTSPQIELLIPKGEKPDYNTIQRLEDIKFSCDEDLIKLIKNHKNKNYKKEDIIPSESPEISIDLPKQILLKKNKFEITYKKDENKLQKQKKQPKKEKTEKIKKTLQMPVGEKRPDLDEKNQLKAVKKLSKQVIKKSLNEEISNMKAEIASELNALFLMHYQNLTKKNIEASQKLNKILSEISMKKKNSPPADNFFKNSEKNIHQGFTCFLCKKTPILGIRYKCSVCKSFDICENCESKTDGNVHPHPFIKIRTEDLNPIFIKTIAFDDDNQDFTGYNNALTENIINNRNAREKYIEEIIDLDQINNNNSSNYNLFNLDKTIIENSDILNYFKNKYQFAGSCCSQKMNNNNNIFNINKISDNAVKLESLNIACLNVNEVIEIKNFQAKEFKILLKIQNTGKTTLPNPCYLQCINRDSTIVGRTVPINFSLKPGMTINPEITLEIPDLCNGMYLSVWRMQTPQREFFGDEIPLKIKIEKSDDLKIKNNYIEAKLPDEKINWNDILNRNKVVNEKEIPHNSLIDQQDCSVNSNNENNNKIISLALYKKLKMLKKKSENSIKEEKKQIDFFELADDIIKRNPEKNIKRKALINALFRTGGHEKNSIDMATNENLNVCVHHKKHMYN